MIFNDYINKTDAHLTTPFQYKIKFREHYGQAFLDLFFDHYELNWLDFFFIMLFIIEKQRIVKKLYL